MIWQEQRCIAVYTVVPVRCIVTKTKCMYRIGLARGPLHVPPQNLVYWLCYSVIDIISGEWYVATRSLVRDPSANAHEPQTIIGWLTMYSMSNNAGVRNLGQLV